MTPEWRKFEKLIARIEQAMAPTGAVVTSPDRIPDKVTGELREVDASIRYKVGTSPVLITIECRDRTAVEDVRWIEQLAEKQRGIGASISVAVSSSGFSEPAIKKAAAVGIQVRVLNDATPCEFVQWLSLDNCQIIVDEWALAELNLELFDAPDDAAFLPAFQDSFRLLGPRAPLFIRNVDGRRYHVENVLIEWRNRNGSFFPADLPCDGSKVRRYLHLPLGRGSLQVETTKGRFDIRVIHVGLLLTRIKSPMPVARLCEYADANCTLVQTAQWDILENIKLSLHHDVASGEIKGQVGVE